MKVGDSQEAASGGLALRLYGLLRDRYLVALCVGAGGSIVALTALVAALAMPYVEVSSDEYMRDLLFVIPWMAVVGANAGIQCWRTLRPVSRWSNHRTSDEARTAWEAAVLSMPRTVVMQGIAVSVWAIPAALFVARDKGAEGMVAAAAGCTVCIAAGTGLHYFIWDRALSPIVREIAAVLPPGFRSHRKSLSITGRLLVLVPAMNLVTACVLAVPSWDNLQTLERTSLAIAAALGVTALVAFPLMSMLRGAVLDPVAELLAAMARVERGDLRTELPVVAADEMSVVAEHFNAMVGGLRDRESLRERNVHLVAELEQAAESLRASRARIVAAADAERRRMERDLHDGAQQHLVLLRLKLAMLERKFADHPEHQPLLAELKTDIESAAQELRDLAHGIYPASLENDGLPAALHDAAQRAAISTTVDCDGIGRYPREIEAAIYFFCLEALQNATKHAGDNADARIVLREDEGELRFEVADNGQGFDGDASGHGIQNMTDRIGALAGQVNIASQAGRGTTVTGSVPLADETGVRVSPRL